MRWSGDDTRCITSALACQVKMTECMCAKHAPTRRDSCKNCSLCTRVGYTPHSDWRVRGQPSELVDLGRHDLRMVFSEFLAARGLVVERALVSVSIAMEAAELIAAPADKAC